MLRNIGKGCVIFFIIFWMFNCASEELGSGSDASSKDKPTDEVDLVPRPTRLKK
jgi:hypothetical protein